MNQQTAIDLYCSRELHDRLRFQGLQISIENAKGTTRRGVGSDGKPWATTMTWPYGYIRMSTGADGDHVDCFIGPNPNATQAHVIHTQDPVTKKYDEDKCMLGWDTPEAAKQAFMDNYSHPGFFLAMTTLPMDKFKSKVLATKDRPGMVANSEIPAFSTFMEMPVMPTYRPPLLEDEEPVDTSYPDDEATEEFNQRRNQRVGRPGFLSTPTIPPGQQFWQ